MTVSVPSQYQSLVQAAAKGSGLPYNVVAAQWNDESGFNPGAVSSAGAEGIAQFEPSTWSGEGCSGSPFSPTASEKCYAKYMSQLLSQEGGSVYKALEAYNAGPGNLAAGAGYASSILSAAGQGTNLTATPGSGSGSGGPSSGSGSACVGPTLFGQCIGITLPDFGSDITDWLERGALIVFGAIIVIIGLLRLTGASQKIETTAKTVAPEAAEAAMA